MVLGRMVEAKTMVFFPDDFAAGAAPIGDFWIKKLVDYSLSYG